MATLVCDARVRTASSSCAPSALAKARFSSNFVGVTDLLELGVECEPSALPVSTTSAPFAISSRISAGRAALGLLQGARALRGAAGGG
jgi:hypothetical protein